MNQQSILITGGSSGIGLAMSHRFASEGARLFIVSKPQEELDAARAELLAQYPNLELETLAIDLSTPGAPKKVYQTVQEKAWTIDILVNNAGFGTYGFINDIDMERETDMINLNILCVYQLSRFFLKDMVHRNKGHILNISSISAFQPNPLLATYGATKSFVYNFGRALNYELRKQKSAVRVTTICPTPVRTKFQQASEMEASSLFDSWMTVDADFVAERAIKALKQKKDMVIPGALYHWLNEISRRLPTPFLMQMAAGYLKRKN